MFIFCMVANRRRHTIWALESGLQTCALPIYGVRWPEGPFCPHCCSFNATRLEGKKHRAGLIQCNDCREQYTVTVGTIFERSKVPLHKWLLCNHLLCADRKSTRLNSSH